MSVISLLNPSHLIVGYRSAVACDKVVQPLMVYCLLFRQIVEHGVKYGMEICRHIICFIFKLLMRLVIPSIAIGSEYLLGYLEFCGYLTPVFNGGANLIYDFGCFLVFQHVVTASGE